MKVGILTFHRAINYGAVLQAYALQETLIHLGHEVKVIDYYCPRVEKHDRSFYSIAMIFRTVLTGHIRRALFYLRCRQEKKIKLGIFDSFLKKRLKLSAPCIYDNIPDDIDVYIVGSDQVWNTHICEGFDPVFWGLFRRKEKSKIISYAASTSISDISGNDFNKITTYLSSFSALSVREVEVTVFLNEHIPFHKYRHLAVHTTIDPTLLANKDIWDTFDESNSDQNDNYILVFSARAYKSNPNLMNIKAHQLAKEYDCSIKTIDFLHDSPELFVNKIKKAKAVITSSFHGVAFSIIYSKPLYAITYGDEQDSRYVNLLRQIGAEKFIFSINSELKKMNDVGYNDINNNLTLLKKSSMNFLIENLQQ